MKGKKGLVYNFLLKIYSVFRMDNDYNQCVKSVQNFNCSYAEEWNYLKRKHLKNITNMK